MMIKRTLVVALCVAFLYGCSWEQVDDTFSLSMPEYDAKWNPDLRWAMEDVHAYANLETDQLRAEYMDVERYRNGTCLLSAERKYELALQHGYEKKHLEIVVIKLNEDTALKADWSRGWPTHAVLRYKDEIFDNGFISDTPFDKKYLSRYGEIISDQWSKYRIK